MRLTQMQIEALGTVAHGRGVIDVHVLQTPSGQVIPSIYVPAFGAQDGNVIVAPDGTIVHLPPQRTH